MPISKVMKSYLENKPIYSYIQEQSFSANLASILMYNVAFDSPISNDSTLETKMPACLSLVLSVLSLKNKTVFPDLSESKPFCRDQIIRNVVCKSKIFTIETTLRQIHVPS